MGKRGMGYGRLAGERRYRAAPNPGIIGKDAVPKGKVGTQGVKPTPLLGPVDIVTGLRTAIRLAPAHGEAIDHRTFIGLNCSEHGIAIVASVRTAQVTAKPRGYPVAAHVPSVATY